jgi:hypothetical protein
LADNTPFRSFFTQNLLLHDNHFFSHFRLLGFRDRYANRRFFASWAWKYRRWQLRESLLDQPHAFDACDSMCNRSGIAGGGKAKFFWRHRTAGESQSGCQLTGDDFVPT